jgi:hypothetical protein
VSHGAGASPQLNLNEKKTMAGEKSFLQKLKSLSPMAALDTAIAETGPGGGKKAAPAPSEELKEPKMGIFEKPEAFSKRYSDYLDAKNKKK